MIYYNHRKHHFRKEKGEMKMLNKLFGRKERTYVIIKRQWTKWGYEETREEVTYSTREDARRYAEYLNRIEKDKSIVYIERYV